MWLLCGSASAIACIPCTEQRTCDRSSDSIPHSSRLSRRATTRAPGVPTSFFARDRCRNEGECIEPSKIFAHPTVQKRQSEASRLSSVHKGCAMSSARVLAPASCKGDPATLSSLMRVPLNKGSKSSRIPLPLSCRCPVAERSSLRMLAVGLSICVSQLAEASMQEHTVYDFKPFRAPSCFIYTIVASSSKDFGGCLPSAIADREMVRL
mmetsp:Transcript_33320/g.53674  ORF Transcript_33320/g.53674 Transcript_33320/m.53674 type:complete len:209 (-) Transcript_33320:1065-1691(-)